MGKLILENASTNCMAASVNPVGFCGTCKMGSTLIPISRGFFRVERVDRVLRSGGLGPRKEAFDLRHDGRLQAAASAPVTGLNATCFSKQNGCNFFYA